MNWLFYILFNFVFYSFFGWILEEVYSFFVFGYFKEEGFLSIPFKPMYGIAMCILILFYYKLQINNFMFILMCIIVPTTVEFISGYLLKYIFNLEFWCYNNQFLNYKGLICFKFALYWTFLTFFFIRYIQPYIYKFYCIFMKANNIIMLLLFLYIIVDLSCISYKRYKEVQNSKNFIQEYRNNEHISNKIKNS